MWALLVLFVGLVFVGVVVNVISTFIMRKLFGWGVSKEPKLGVWGNK